MNVVIITYDWPPRNAVSVHRPYSWAKYLAELGVDVTILTAAKRSFDEPLVAVVNIASNGVRNLIFSRFRFS